MDINWLCRVTQEKSTARGKIDINKFFKKYQTDSLLKKLSSRDACLTIKRMPFLLKRRDFFSALAACQW